MIRVRHEQILTRNSLPYREFIDEPDFREQLEHWQADVGVYGTIHERPCDRFVREQPHLIATVRSNGAEEGGSSKPIPALCQGAVLRPQLTAFAEEHFDAFQDSRNLGLRPGRSQP